MRPTAPSLPISMPSYSRWASIMVRFTLKRSLRAASCCKVEAMNGATGLRFFSRVATLFTTSVALADVLTHVADGIVAHAHRIGAHEGDETHRPFLADLDAFIQPLGQHHGAF